MKRKLLLILTMLFAVIGTLAFAAACGGDSGDENKDLVAGEEAGEYYLDADGKEYNLTLTEKCEFTLDLGGDPVTGTYTAEGEVLTFTAADQSTFSGTYFNDAVTLSYSSATYKFLRKVEYTVTFEANGGSAVSPQKVINGRPAQKPEDPKRGDDVFIGWYTDDGFRSPYRFGDPVTADIKLYARFVTPIEPEYTVTFDLNGAEGKAPASVKTVGHQAFGLPTPAWTGHTFVGWWVSHYNDGTQLTYQYDEQLLGANTTLYAVWEGQAPAVSVDGGKISWTPVGSNSQYTVVVTNPAAEEGEQEVLRRTAGGGQTSIQFDFSGQKAGEYVIEVTANGQTGRAYYKNKALDKVTVFEVMNSTLLFNAVDNATSYLLEIQCGIEGHTDHLTPVEISANSRSYDFSSCEMRQDGSIIFTVTALADGYLSSVSEPFAMRRELPAVTGIAVEPTTELLHWAETDGATSYEVTVKQGETTLYSGTVEGTSLSLKYYNKGKLDITVAPKARGWNMPEPTEFPYDKTTLAAPSNIHAVATASKIDWDDVLGATGYEVKIGDHAAVTVTSSEIVFNETYYVSGQVDYAVTVRALTGTGSGNSLWSDAYNVRYGELGDTLTYRDGVLSWDPVFGVSEYYLSVNDGEEKRYDNVSQIEVVSMFTASGHYSFALRAVYADETKEADTIRCSVDIYELSFDSQGSEQTFGNRYLAYGDKLDLPGAEDVTLFGNNFAGWYTDPDDGDLYNDGLFHDQIDRKLYAHWTPMVFHIELNVGIYGEETPEIVAGKDAEYGKPVQLPIPTPKDSVYGFTGWYDSPTGEVPYTNADGLIAHYMQGNAITLYAQWVEVMSFTPVYKNGAIAEYTVSKSRDIVLSNSTELTIPATYQGKPVTEVIDFTDCDDLEVIRIPDTIRYIAVATTESAFTGCDSLRAIEIYTTDSTGDKYYFSEDGVLFYNNPETHMRELRMYPVARAAESYEIPDGVQVLPGNCIWDVDSLGEVIIPSSVTLIETSAIGYSSTSSFYYTSLITAITFKAADGQAEPSLSIHEGAFYNLTELTDLTLPSRLENLDLYAIFGGSSSFDPNKLTSFSIAGTGGKYYMQDGVLLENLGTDGTKLLFYPSSKTDVTIPDGVTQIAANAARGNTKIKTLVIPSSVEEIGAYAFYGCTYVTSFSFAGTAGDRPLNIGEFAFYQLGYYASSENSGVNAVVLPGNLASLGAHAFGGTEIRTVTLNSSARIETGAFHNVSSLSSQTSTKVTKLIIGAAVKDINFLQIFGTTDANVTVEVVKENPYYVSETLSEGTTEHNLIYTKGANDEKTELAWFKSLPADFTLPDTVTRIAARTFRGYTRLKSITIPASVTYIGDEAFAADDSSDSYQAMGLTTVTFSAPQTGTRADLNFGNRVFSGCKQLTQFTFPEGTKYIGMALFEKCEALEEVHFPASLETIQPVPEVNNWNGTSSDTFGMFPNSAASNKVKTITVAEGSHFYKAKDGVLYKLRYETLTNSYVESEVLYFAPRSETTEVTIPNTVKRIWSYAFYGFSTGNSNKLKKVSFSDTKLAQTTDADGNTVAGTLEIGIRAFGSCANLTDVTLPEGTTKLGPYAFNGCAFATFTVPGTVTSIGDNCFSYCSNLTTINFAEGTAELRLEDPTSALGSSIFHDCPLLRKVELPERTTYIGISAFSGITLDEVVIPASLREIGDKAFTDSKIPTITFKDAENSKLETIAYEAFYGAAITKIAIPASVRVIEDQAFRGALSLESFTVADNAALEILGDGSHSAVFVFMGCTSLQTVDFGENSRLRAISSDLFNGCTALKSVTIPLSVETIGEDAFADSGIEHITFEEKEGELSKLHIVEQAFSGSHITEFSFPETEFEISLAENVFHGCTTLKTVHISSKVYNLRGAFNGVEGIQSVTVAEDNPSYEVDETQPFLMSKANGDILLVFGEISGRLAIPEKSVQIGASAFMGTAVEEVWIPRTVMRIDEAAFKNCASLTKVEFEEGSALVSIGKEAFSGCTQLADIDFTKTLQLSTLLPGSGSSNTFKNCTSLTALDFGYTRITNIPANTFAGCTNLEKLTLPRTLTSMQATLGHTKIASIDLGRTGISELPENFFKDSEQLTSIVLPSVITTIGAFAFAGCEGLTAMDLTGFGALREIGNSAFKDCINLATVKLSTSVATLRYGCFQGCTGLTSIDLGKVETVEYAAFYGSGLTEVTLPGTVTTWEGGEVWDDEDWEWDTVRPSEKTGTFGACEDLQKVTFAYSMTADTTLPTYMFAGCTSLDTLNTLTFQSGCKLAKLPNYMFKGCTSLQSVKLPESITALGSGACYVFQNCTGLQTADLSETSIESLNPNLFDGCTGLKTVKLPHGLTSLPTGQLFYNNASIETVELPDTLTEIPSDTFKNCTSLKTIDLSHITKIGSNAFMNTGLTSVTLPITLVDVDGTFGFQAAIGSGAFRDCASLASVTFAQGSTLTMLEQNVFANCPKLTTVNNLPATLTTIGASAFEKTALTTFTIPANVSVIGNKAFSGSSLVTLTISCKGSVTTSSSSSTVPNSVFMDCKSLFTVKIEKGLQEIGESWFSGCITLTTVTLPETVTKIGKSAFKDCTALDTIDTSHVTEMGEGAFENCTKLFETEENWKDGVFYLGNIIVTFDDTKIKAANGEVTIKDGTESIGNKMFYGSTALKKITLPDSILSIGTSAFENCAALTEIDFTKATKLTELPQKAFAGCSQLTTVNLPDSITKLGSECFANSGISEFTITVKMGDIGSNAFNGSKLTTVTFAEPAGDETAALTVLPSSLFKNCASLATVKLNTKITEIGMNCFEGCTSLKTFDFKNVGTIGSSAFKGAGLTTVTIPEAVTGSYPNNLGPHAFENCTDLAEVNFASPEKFKNIAEALFKGCTSLQSISLPENIPAVNESSFENSGLKSIVIPASVAGIGKYAFKGCASLASVTLPASLKDKPDGTSSVAKGLLDNAFENCTALTEIDFKVCTQLTVLPNSLFKGCTLLATVNLPETLTEIGANCFEGTAVKFDKLPDTVSTIGAGAFKDCTGITTFTLPKALKNFHEDSYEEVTEGLGKGVFEGCTNLATVTFPEDIALTQLSDNTFKGCTSLTTVNLPEKLTKIGSSAFEGCTALKKLTLPKSVTSLSSNFIKGCTLDLLEIPGNPTLYPYSTYFSNTTVKAISITDASDPNNTQINSYFSGLVSITGLEKIIIAASVKAINSSAFANLPAGVTLCFKATEEVMKENFTGGETAWNTFKESLPEGAKVEYGYTEGTEGE